MRYETEKKRMKFPSIAILRNHNDKKIGLKASNSEHEVDLTSPGVRYIPSCCTSNTSILGTEGLTDVSSVGQELLPNLSKFSGHFDLSVQEKEPYEAAISRVITSLVREYACIEIRTRWDAPCITPHLSLAGPWSPWRVFVFQLETANLSVAYMSKHFRVFPSIHSPRYELRRSQQGPLRTKLT